jgi:16S rRNA (uracil1498-N3)-methyltransferase
MAEIRTRLFVDAPLAEGGTPALAPEQAHYLRNVLRLGAGDQVALFNGRDGEWRVRIESLDRRTATMALEERLRPQAPEPDLWLLFAPIKRARIDYLVEKATELGASALLPVITQRTNVERMNLERLRAHAVEAAEQSERLTVPAIHAPVPLAAAIEAWEPARRLVLCDESGTAPPIAAALQGQGAAAWALFIGPEGGFSGGELDALKKLPFVLPVSLGPRILRADTAALAGLAVLQAIVEKAPRRR